MSRDERLYLEDIVTACEKILRFTNGITFDDLLRDEKTYDAVVRNLEVIGEAAKHISDEIRGKISDIDWRKAAGLRDMLSHVYFGIDNNILWNVIQNKVPHLRETIQRFFEQAE
jgi:uncharacterized protein with HEPN domain